MNPLIDEEIPISKEYHVDIPCGSAQARALNLPCQDLLDEGKRQEYIKICVPLYRASRKGDWETAKDILDNNKEKELVRCSITKNCETALHVAVFRKKTEFVENLVALMDEKDLELQNKSSYTALCIAVRRHHVKIARILLQKNKALIDIPTSLGMMPLHIAASYNKGTEMVKFLYENSQRLEGIFWTPESRNSFLLTCLEAEYFDVAMNVLKDRPEQHLLNGWGVLKVLAQKHQAFRSERRPALQLLRSMLKNIAKLPWPKVYDLMRGPADPINKEKTEDNPKDTPKKYSSRVLFLAAEVGNIVFIVEIIRQYPELLNDVNDVNQSIFHVAISHRHVEVFSLLNEIGSVNDRIITLEDENGNNMLHLAGIFTESAKSSYNYRPGPVQQMQREVLWFKEVENMLPISLRKKKNGAGRTPHEEFIKNHKYLFSDCEKWIKDTGSQLIVVAALLATISFAATITFPGGYNQNNGYPILITNRLFPSFILFNSTAFLSASSSMICTLFLVTSRYDEGSFKLIPMMLMGAILALLISIVASVIAFMFNLFLLFEKDSPLLPKLSIIIITSLVYMSFGLVGDIFANIYYGRRAWKKHVRYERDLMLIE